MSIANESKLGIVIDNKPYKLYKESHKLSIGETLSCFENTIKSGTSFVATGIGMGAAIGIAYKLSNVLHISNPEEIVTTAAFLFICVSLAQANAIFDNIKKDKKRYNRLAVEIQKQKLIDEEKKYSTNLDNPNYRINKVATESPLFFDVKQDYEKANEDSENSIDMGKRLSLNNGIFKPNDNYKS